MSIDKKILSEIQRYNSINKYIMEQAAEPAPDDLGALAPDAGAAPPPPPSDAAAVPPPPPGGEAAPEAGAPAPIDVENDPDVEKIGDDGESEEKGKDESGDSEELDITDLVTTQKDTQSKQDEYFENLFGQLGKLESRLGEMDAIMNKLNALENKIEKYREKTPQKLSQFFDDKSEEMEKTGKNDYVLTPDDVTDINVNDIKNSFQNKSNGFEDEFKYK